MIGKAGGGVTLIVGVVTPVEYNMSSIIIGLIGVFTSGVSLESQCGFRKSVLVAGAFDFSKETLVKKGEEEE